MHLWYPHQDRAESCSSRISILLRHFTVMLVRDLSKWFLRTWTSSSNNNSHSFKLFRHKWDLINSQICGLNNSKMLSWLDLGCKTLIWWIPKVVTLSSSNSNSSGPIWWVNLILLWVRCLQTSNSSLSISIQTVACSSPWTPWWCSRCKCNKGRALQQTWTKVATTPSLNSGDLCFKV